MSYDSEVEYFTTPSGAWKLRYYRERAWQNSPRVNGILTLRSNPYSVYEQLNTLFIQTKDDFYQGPDIWSVSSATGWPSSDSARNRAYNQAYGRFRGKLHKGGASLGITIAQYKQSADMIKAKAKIIGTDCDRTIQRYLRSRKRNFFTGIGGIPSMFLEALFGWLPLMTDMWAAANTVIQLAPRYEGVRARGKASYWDHFEDPSSRISFAGEVRVTLSSRVRVSNPNLWLLNRAGLLNPAAIAWDAVPGSFLINWFVNVNSLINSVSDFVGLEFDNTAILNAYSGEGHYFAYDAPPPYNHAYSKSSWKARDVFRDVGLIPSPSLEFRLPKVDWGGAAIASSLAAQKVSSIRNFGRF